MQNVIWFENLRMSDVPIVGGKNASLGEMISQLTKSGIRVPNGFATTSFAYKNFINENNLVNKINDLLNTLEPDDVIQLAKIARQIQKLIQDASFSEEFVKDISNAYFEMEKLYGKNLNVAVRSSATAEDLPDASFAGQQDTYLNISGIENILKAIKNVFASLFNDRAISYRMHKNFNHSQISISAGIQKMVRSDIASSGVMFTLDTESGFDKVIFITSSYGLGEAIVQGMVNPDEFYVYKPSLRNNKKAIIRKVLGNKMLQMEFKSNDFASKTVQSVSVKDALRKQFSLNEDKIIELANFGLIIEDHYKCPMDIEWALDGIDKNIYIVQARPETVKSQEKSSLNKQVRFKISSNGKILVSGRAVGQKASTGVVKVIKDIKEINNIKKNDIIVADMTDPDWEPVMKIANAIVTNRGGRTCHAAIIARELGIPAIVGTNNATEILKDGMNVTVSCCEGDTGNVYEGSMNIEKLELNVDKMPDLPVKIMMNIANPELAFNFSSIPNFGVGLARLEFIINKEIGIHPKALLEFHQLPLQLQEIIKEKISGYEDPITYYVEKLAEGIATIGAAFSPRKVIVRLSDFKSNEYSNLVGGKLYEPIEENPMMGFRGASRYIANSFRDCFELECLAIRKVRDEIGLDNVAIMVPFVRTIEEAKKVLELLKENGLERGVDKLEIYMMCEIPSNAILANEFLKYFDGFSIGSNDMTQLTLGIDRDANGIIAASFDERNEAVKSMLELAINACKKANKYVGICGQGPSDHKDLAKWLIEKKIDTISLNPDTVVDTWLYLAENK